MEYLFIIFAAIVIIITIRHLEKTSSKQLKVKRKIRGRKKGRRTKVVIKKESVISLQEREPEITADQKGNTCPYCSQSIDSNAVVCKHCGRALIDPTDIGFQKELQTKIQEPIDQMGTPSIASNRTKEHRQEAVSIHTPLEALGERNLLVDILLWIIFHMIIFVFIGVFLYPDFWFPGLIKYEILEWIFRGFCFIAAFGGGILIAAVRWIFFRRLRPHIKTIDWIFSCVVVAIIGLLISMVTFMTLGNIPTEKEYLRSIVFLVSGTVIVLTLIQAYMVRKIFYNKAFVWAFSTAIYFILVYVLSESLIYTWSNDWTTQIVLSTFMVLIATGLSGWGILRIFRSLEGIQNIQKKSSPLFFSSNMKKAELEGKNLAGANLDGVDFSFANLRRANLTSASLEPVIVNRKFRLIDLVILILLFILGGEGDSDSEKVWRSADLSDADLTGSVLENAKMSEALLERTILVKAKMKNAFLQGAVLMDADLRGADLSYANLRNVLLCRANLEGAILQNAILEGADFQKANLSNADLRNVNFTGVTFEDAILDGVILSEGYELSSIDSK